ncbi:unnamed protein product, partial [Symbiodinium sp. KB8]
MRPAMLQPPPSCSIRDLVLKCSERFGCAVLQAQEVPRTRCGLLRDPRCMLARTRDPLFTDAMRCEFASWKLDAGNFTKVCALKPDLFLLVPPHCGNPPCILLRDPPTGFELWYEKLPQRCSQTPEEEAMRNLRESISAGRISSMRKVIDELYADRIEPTLNEVQERLRDRGWSYSDAQQAVLLYACQKDTYDLAKPTQNKQIVVLLKDI